MRLTGETNEQGGGPDQGRRPVIWFEVEDFVRYFDHFRNPTGLQRVAIEVFVEAWRLYGASRRVRFCRLSVYTKQLVPADYETVMSAYANPPGVKAPWKSLWEPARFGRNLLGALRVVLRHPRFFLSISRVAIRDLIDARLRPHRFERAVKPGDILVSLGGTWGVPGYLDHIIAAKRRFGIRFVPLVHDLIPIENPSFVEPWHAAQFRVWLERVAACADVVLTISRHSRDALIALGAAAKWSLPRVEVLDLGSLSKNGAPDAVRDIRLPPRFALFVSTVEIRKNHRLLVRVWRRLIERHGADAVPVLIFAGQIGWLVDDLLADLKASNYLGGRIEHVRLSDAQLQLAYRSCLFTVFPSLSEGWGLPIAESLEHGKFCVASDRTSMPEVGGDFVDYFDPTDESDALAKIERVLFEPGYLEAREARLRAEYRPRSWTQSVHELVGKLDQPIAAERKS
jgi:glycosyltransferase involved in cell wall biosynthesis